MRAVKLFLLVTLIIIAAVSCQRRISRAPEDGVAGGDLVVGIINEPENLSPLYPSFTAHNEITDMIFLPMHKINTEGRIVPMLAKSWAYSEDLTEITYYLQDNIVWQDNTPVTARDVEFTFNTMKNPDNGYPLLSKLQYIDSVKAVDKLTVVFYFSRVYPRALYDSNIKTMPRHLLKDEDNIRFADFHSSPVGNGPYKLEEWENGKYITLARNENYSLEEGPFLKRIIYRIFSDQDKLIESLKKGEADLAYDISPDKQKAIEDLGNVNLITKDGNIYTYLGFNTTKAPFNDKNIRLAVSKLINREGLIRNYVGGNAMISNGPLTPAFWAYSNDIAPITFNREQAEELLKEKFVKRYNKYYHKEDKYDRFDFTILTDKNDVEMVKIANAIDDQLSGYGIRVDVQALESSALISRLINKDFDAYVLSWKVDDNFNPFPFWSSDKEIGTFNFVGYYNDNIDKMLNNAISTMEKDEAMRYWKEFQSTIMEDQPYAFLYIPNRIIAVNNIIKSVDNVYESDIDILSNLDIFYVETQSQKDVNIAQIIEEEEKEEKKTTKLTTPRREEPKQPTASQMLSEAAAKTPTKTEEEEKEEEKVEEVAEEPAKPSIKIQPQLQKLVQPSYPDAAASVGAEGTVFVQVTVGTDGSVTDAKVLKGDNQALNNAALSAAKKCKFKPGTVDGEPAVMKATIPYRFVAP